MISCLTMNGVTGFQKRLLVAVPLRTTRWNKITRFFFTRRFQATSEARSRVQVWASDSIFENQKPDRRHLSHVRKTG